MRFVIWLVLLFVVAVVAALTLGSNDGLASFYWAGWRVDISLNLFLLLLVASCFALVTAIQAIEALTTLPKRAREWRLAQRERNAQLALREALVELFGARYSRAQKAAQKALNIQSATPELAADQSFMALAHLLAAASAHRLQDRRHRDEQLNQALDLAQRAGGTRAHEDGARLLAAEWALDDRDATRALAVLGELAPGVARRTQALRLRLQASRLARQPLEALRTARLLAKHQAFSKAAAQSLLRSLAFEALDGARDVDQLRAAWQQLDGADRRDPLVASRAAQCAAQLGAPDDGRGWLRPFFDNLAELQADDRAALATALVPVLAGCGPDWLQRLEAAQTRFPRERALAYALGHALAERQLWGKARLMLETVAEDSGMPNASRRRSWLALAALAEQEGDDARRARCFESAARLP
ncbi:heme biosynthesis HemY N-terminal domain-containing protein [Roseateles puraquae]|uniref:Porphyrin biosynthesis protein n=1 Tax=Roseateles puraquae TaxID=431059 RepID=A0A254N766_9BURK|nr:heme biosynthesis HemY N-terminal domain-containing protein [Roseateles puraquae]MDG0854488.1 heme biosynthesis protein HemY [Roseateles puraquae]OWR03851.1 porphyrin biosynthesis protein [Roseateles puraquae]